MSVLTGAWGFVQFGECISPTVHCPLVGICATTLFRLLPGLSLAGFTLITPDSGYTFFPAVSSLSRSFTMGVMDSMKDRTIAAIRSPNSSSSKPAPSIAVTPRWSIA